MAAPGEKAWRLVRMLRRHAGKAALHERFIARPRLAAPAAFSFSNAAAKAAGEQEGGRRVGKRTGAGAAAAAAAAGAGPENPAK